MRDDYIFEQLSSKLKESDKSLLKWLSTNSTMTLYSLWAILENRVFLTKESKRFLANAYTKNWELETQEKVEASTLLILELKDYAGHTLNLKSKPDYQKTLKTVHNRTLKHFKIKYKKTESIREMEKNIAIFLVEHWIKTSSPKDLDEVFNNSATTKDELLHLISTGHQINLNKIVGKSFTKHIAKKIIGQILTSYISKKSSKKVALFLSKKVSSKAFNLVSGGLGAGFLLKDFFDFGGEATRVTTPLVINISFLRTLSLLEKPITD